MQKSYLPFYYPDIIAHICVWFLLRYRKWKYGYTFRKIKLTQNKYAIVDPEDFEKINQYKWYVTFNGYTFYAERKERIQDKELPPAVLPADKTNRRGLPPPRFLFNPLQSFSLGKNFLTNRRSVLRSEVKNLPNNSGVSALLRRSTTRKRTIRMHRQIMNPPRDKVIDHINRN